MVRRPVTRHLLPALLALLFALPVLLMVAGSLRGRGLPPPQGLEILPASPGLDAYRALPELLPVATYVRNSVLVVAIAVPLTVLVAGLAGYGIRLLRGRAKRIAIVLTLIAMMVPQSAVWTTRFVLFRAAGVIDTLVPLVAPALLGTSPFLILIYAWAMHRIPDEQLEAARLDGASTLRSWRTVVMPQVRAATMAVVVIAFTFHWGNFIDPLLYINSQSNFTAPLGLRLLQQLNPTDWPLMLAGAVAITVPALVVFLYGQRVFLDDPVRHLRGESPS